MYDQLIMSYMKCKLFLIILKEKTSRVQIKKPQEGIYEKLCEN